MVQMLCPCLPLTKKLLLVTNAVPSAAGLSRLTFPNHCRFWEVVLLTAAPPRCVELG